MLPSRRTMTSWVSFVNSSSHQAAEQRLLHVEPVLRLLDDERLRRRHDGVGRLHVATEREAVAEPSLSALGERHLPLVDDEVLVRFADGLLRLPAAEVGEGAPALRVDDV